MSCSQVLETILAEFLMIDCGILGSANVKRKKKNVNVKENGLHMPKFNGSHKPCTIAIL